MINNTSLYLPIVDGDVRMVKCRFDAGGKAYTYKCDMPDIEIGDAVVVEARNSLAIVTVVAVDVTIPAQEDITYKWIVQYIDTKEHQTRLDREEKLIDKIMEKRVAHQRDQMLSALGLTMSDIRPMLNVQADRADDDVVEEVAGLTADDNG